MKLLKKSLRKVKSASRRGLALVLAPLRPIMGKRAEAWLTGQLNPKGKLYIPPNLGVAGFFRALNDANARHVVLRWFEELPYIERGHDLDILIADDAHDAVRALLSQWPVGQKIDYYTVSGRWGTGYAPERLSDIPAFPENAANALLSSANPLPGGWWVPGPTEHFLGLAYHAVYLKGFKAGLPPDPATPAKYTGSRDYAEVLTRLGADVGISVQQPVTMQSLDNMLKQQGWRPTHDHLLSLAPANPWIESLS